MNGSPTTGSEAKYARGDHVHPHDDDKAEKEHEHVLEDITDAGNMAAVDYEVIQTVGGVDSISMLGDKALALSNCLGNAKTLATAGGLATCLGGVYYCTQKVTDFPTAGGHYAIVIAKPNSTDRSVIGWDIATPAVILVGNYVNSVWTWKKVALTNV